jgi:integrase
MVKAYRNAYPVNHRPKSVEWVRERTVHVERLLGNILLPSLTEDRIREYMRQRIQEMSGTEPSTWSYCASVVLTVEKAKSAGGKGRVIPMNSDLVGTLSMHASWYTQALGAPQPNWFVFPFSNRVKPVDPTRPVTDIKTAWGSVRKLADAQCRFHDLRHTTLTKMAEAGIPESTMLALAGHMSRAMLERYSHIRMRAKREAVEAISLRVPASPSVGVPTISPQRLRMRKGFIW